MLQTRKDLLQAHRLMTRRAALALLQAEPDPPDQPLRRLNVGAFCSVLVAGIVAAVFGIWGLVAPGQAGGLTAPDSLLIDQATGTPYIPCQHGKLCPVLNYASARLALNTTTPNQRSVSQASLARYPRGPEIGIAGPSAAAGSRHAGRPALVGLRPDRIQPGHPGQPHRDHSGWRPARGRQANVARRCARGRGWGRGLAGLERGADADPARAADRHPDRPWLRADSGTGTAVLAGRLLAGARLRPAGDPRIRPAGGPRPGWRPRPHRPGVRHQPGRGTVLRADQAGPGSGHQYRGEAARRRARPGAAGDGDHGAGGEPSRQPLGGRHAAVHAGPGGPERQPRACRCAWCTPARPRPGRWPGR